MTDQFPKDVQDTGDDLVVVRVGDRAYRVPRRVTVFMFGAYEADDGQSPVKGRTLPRLHDGEWEVTVDAEVVDGEPRYRRIELVCHAPLSALDVQRMPWAMWLEAAVEKNAAPRDRPATDGPGRLSISDDRLREIVRLHDEAQSLGVRWDTYAADRLDFGAAYLRTLYGRARKAGLAKPAT